MLTANLARSRTTDETVTPLLIDPDQDRFRKTGRELIQLFEEHLGESKGDLEDAIDELLVADTDYKIVQGLAKLLTDECEFDVVAPAEPREIRRRLFERGNERYPIVRQPTLGHDTRKLDVYSSIADQLGISLEDAGTFGYRSESEQRSVRSDATALQRELCPSFRADGDLENLARPTEFEFISNVLYLDLNQEEGRHGRSETSLMMQVLFNAVYELAKATPKKVVFVIDEAHYLLADSASLDFLETAVRHSRHYDLSLQFITQTGGEFSLAPETRTIANLCSMTLFHRVNESALELAEWFGLSERQTNFIRSAKAGNDDDGYSEALLGIDEEG